MSKNPTGGLTGNMEWGSKARKHEDAERGRNNTARKEAIAEQVADLPDHTHTWRYEDSRDAFCCVTCNVWESAD